jgi:hypothetical protein
MIVVKWKMGNCEKIFRVLGSVKGKWAEGRGQKAGTATERM